MAKAPKQADIRIDMEKALAAAAVLKDHLRKVLDEETLDNVLLKDMIEGETELLPLIDQMIFQIGQDAARQEALKQFQSTLGARCARLKEREGSMRAMLLNALDIIGEKKLERAIATVSAKPVPPKLVVSDESMVPSKYFVQPQPVLSNADLTAALKAREAALEELRAEHEAGRLDDDAYRAKRAEHPPIPGAQLGNGSWTVQIRFG